MNSKLQQLIASRKSAIVEASGNVSDSTIDELARNELAQDSIATITNICDNLDKMLKASGVPRDWSTPPKYEYGPVNGMIGKFITQWVYLPDALKQLSGLSVPVTAFTADSITDWGKLTRCTPLGAINESVRPDLASVATQVELVKVYLGLDYTEPVLDQAAWDIKEIRAANQATTKAAKLAEAELQNELSKELGLPSFTV